MTLPSRQTLSICNLMRRRPIELLLPAKVPEGLLSYILRTGTSGTDGRDVYGVTSKVPVLKFLVRGRNFPGDG